MSSAITTTTVTAAKLRMPTIFFSHGAGPCFFLPSFGIPNLDKHSDATRWYRQVAEQVGFTASGKYGRPSSIVVFSAHWETGSPLQITSRTKHDKLLYDYYGFPPESYKIEYNPPGNPSLSARLRSLLEQAGVPSQLNDQRDFDHGVFIPLKLVFPDADIPVVEVSIHDSLDSETHLKIGEAVASLRDEGILFVGSGQITHGRGEAKKQEQFVTSFDSSILNDASMTAVQRRQALLQWPKLEGAQAAHPRVDHFVPMLVVAGAAGCTKPQKFGNLVPSPGFSLASYLFP